MKNFRIFIKSQPWVCYLWNAESADVAWNAFIAKYPVFKTDVVTVKAKDEEKVFNGEDKK